MSQFLHDVGVIFDLDGTLIDTAGDLAASMNHVLAASDFAEISPSAVRHLVGFGARAMLVRGFELRGVVDLDRHMMDGHVAMFLDHYLENLAVTSRPFDGVMAAIDEMRSDGARVAICTNKREKSASMLIKALGMENIFEGIIGGDTVGVAKPDPAPVRASMELLKAKRYVFVGDSDTDILSLIHI